MNFQQGIIKDLSVNLLSKQSQLVNIITSLLHANYTENTRLHILNALVICFPTPAT